MLFFSLKITSHSFLQKSSFCTSCCCPKTLSDLFLKQSLLLLSRQCFQGAHSALQLQSWIRDL